MKRLDRYWYGNSYFIKILDKKIIQNGILSTGGHLNLIQKLLLLCLAQVLKAMLKMQINALNDVKYINNSISW